MWKRKGVPEFVDRFFEKTLLKNECVHRQPIEFLPKAVVRHYRGIAMKLRFTKNKRKYGNVQDRPE